MATTEYLSFSAAVGNDVVDQSEYASATWRQQGWRSGILPHAQINKVLRQATMVAAALTQVVADFSNTSIIDDGSVLTLANKIKSVLSGGLPFDPNATYLPGSVGYALKAINNGEITALSVENLRITLQNALTENELTATLRARIAQLDTPGTGLIDTVAGIIATYGTTASAASSASSAAASLASAIDSANAASISAGNALTSETNSSGSAITATAKADAADQSATNALNSEAFAVLAAQSANGYRAAAQSSAATAASVLTSTQAQATAAANSATSATASAGAAGVSAISADSSATTASTKAGEASTSASSASTSASSASTSASSASTSASSASISANVASGAATTATNQATAAGGSATTAATSATAALSSADAAQSWAVAAQTSSGSAASYSGASASSATAAAGSATNAANYYNATVSATGGLTAAVTAQSNALTEIDGRVGTAEANYVLKTTATRGDGKIVLGAIGVGSTANDDIAQSQIILQSDSLLFVPSSNPNAPLVNMLTIGQVNGVTTLIVPAAIIGDLTVGTLAMANLAATTAKIANNAVSTVVSASNVATTNVQVMVVVTSADIPSGQSTVRVNITGAWHMSAAFAFGIGRNTTGTFAGTGAANLFRANPGSGGVYSFTVIDNVAPGTYYYRVAFTFSNFTFTDDFSASNGNVINLSAIATIGKK